MTQGDYFGFFRPSCEGFKDIPGVDDVDDDDVLFQTFCRRMSTEGVLLCLWLHGWCQLYTMHVALCAILQPVSLSLSLSFSPLLKTFEAIRMNPAFRVPEDIGGGLSWNLSHRVARLSLRVSPPLLISGWRRSIWASTTLPCTSASPAPSGGRFSLCASSWTVYRWAAL